MEGIRATLREITQVPHSWDAWAVRVLTIAVVMVFASVFLLANMIMAAQETLNAGRAERQQFQIEEHARQCAILTELGVTRSRLSELKC